MTDLYRTLQTLIPAGAPVLGPRAALDVAATQKALNGVRQHNDRVFHVLLAMICVLFLLEVVALVAWASQPTKAAAITAASGVTLPFLLHFLRDSWREKVQADTLMVLAAALDPAVLQSVVKAFLDGLKASRARQPRRLAPRLFWAG